MPTSPNEMQIVPDLSTDDLTELPAADSVEKPDLPESTSEVSMRINLLGKLIIPPAPR